MAAAQLAALEKKHFDDEVAGEIETAHPGYLWSQDTYYVGTLKGVGWIYQQTFVDTYSKVAAVKLYTTKTPITAADLLNDRVLPMFEKHELPLLKILTDRGTNVTCRKTLPPIGPDRQGVTLGLSETFFNTCSFLLSVLIIPVALILTFRIFIFVIFFQPLSRDPNPGLLMSMLKTIEINTENVD